MPTSDAIAGNPWLLACAALCAGLFCGSALFCLMAIVPRGSGTMSGVITEAQLLLRRKRSSSESGLFILMLTLIRPITWVLKRVPGTAVLKKDLNDAYAKAGWPGGLDEDELLAIALVIGVVLCVPLTALFFLLMPPLAPAGLLGLALGPGILSTKFVAQSKVRANAIIRVMPFVLDLLVLSLRAGASLSVAMDIVAKDYAGHPLGEEFRATLKDIEMGVTSKTAFENLAQRVRSAVVRTFVDEVIQSEELGRPIADTLERLSDRVRVTRVQEATNLAGKAKVMVLVPGLLVLMATLIILFTPWIVKFNVEGAGVLSQ